MDDGRLFLALCGGDMKSRWGDLKGRWGDLGSCWGDMKGRWEDMKGGWGDMRGVGEKVVFLLIKVLQLKILHFTSLRSE